MPTIEIPEPFRPTLERIALMPEADFQKVQQALTQLAPHVKPEVMVKRATSKLDVPELGEIVKTLASLSLARTRFDVALDDFVRDLTRTTKKEPALLESRLKVLLSIESLLQSARAFDVQHEYEKVFRSARILTDMRPIFNAAGTEATGALIVHNLNISYTQNSELKEDVFAMDDEDVVELKRVLERAEVKSATLEAIIAKSGIPYFASKD